MRRRWASPVIMVSCIWAIFVAVFSAQSYAANDTVNLRIYTGYGSVNTDYGFKGQDEEGQNIVLQLMQFIPEGPFPHAWGLEIGRFSVLSTAIGDLDYDSVSLFVESVPFKSVHWLRANIGTSGYFGDGLSDNKVFGTRVGLGAEIPINDRFRFLGFLRKDTIYDEEKTSIFTLQLGLQLRLR